MPVADSIMLRRRRFAGDYSDLLKIKKVANVVGQETRPECNACAHEFT